MSVETTRQRLARHVPPVIRKLIRMGEHYVRRHGEWAKLLNECEGVSRADKLTLAMSCVAAPLTSLRRLDGFEPPLLLRDAQLEVPAVGRFEIRAGTDDIIHIQTSREPHVAAKLREILRPGDVFVDAGANIGFYTLLAGRLVGPAGRVIAVEMMPETAARLRQHIADNGLTQAEVVEHALAQFVGRIVKAQTDGRKHGQASIALASEAANLQTIEVRTTTLDQVLAGVPAVRAMKMDLEGAEYLALKGGAQSLARISTIIFESNERDACIFSLLEQAGFSVSGIGGHDYVAERT